MQIVERVRSWFGDAEESEVVDGTMGEVGGPIGCAAFGIVVGYIAYRTLARSGSTAAVSDLAAVIASIGGATVTAFLPNDEPEMFAWYAIGLLLGMSVYLTLSRAIRGRRATAEVMGSDSGVLPPPRQRGTIRGSPR